MKLLESNGVIQSAFSGIATNYLNSEFQNGYLKNVLNECDIIKVSSNTITIDTGFIFFQGLRIFFDEAYSVTIPNYPASTLLYHLILQVSVVSAGDNKIEVIYRPIEPLRRDDILKDMSGIYQLELATFTLSPSGITDFSKVIQPIALTNEELQDLKDQINDLDIAFKEIKQTIITANEDAANALSTITNFKIGTVYSGQTPSAETIVDVVGKGITLNLVLPKGETGATGPAGTNGTNGKDAQGIIVQKTMQSISSSTSSTPNLTSEQIGLWNRAIAFELTLVKKSSSSSSYTDTSSYVFQKIPNTSSYICYNPSYGNTILLCMSVSVSSTGVLSAHVNYDLRYRNVNIEDSEYQIIHRKDSFVPGYDSAGYIVAYGITKVWVIE